MHLLHQPYVWQAFEKREGTMITTRFGWRGEQSWIRLTFWLSCEKLQHLQRLDTNEWYISSFDQEVRKWRYWWRWYGPFASRAAQNGVWFLSPSPNYYIGDATFSRVLYPVSDRKHAPLALALDWEDLAQPVPTSCMHHGLSEIARSNIHYKYLAIQTSSRLYSPAISDNFGAITAIETSEPYLTWMSVTRRKGFGCTRKQRRPLLFSTPRKLVRELYAEFENASDKWMFRNKPLRNRKLADMLEYAPQL